jgi:uncharacterized protein (TIGR02453 family)
VAFRGWPVEAIEFFEGLEADNSRTYWHAHKPIYDTAVRAPMQELLHELEPTWGEGRIFRPNRDVRFSRDKSPYKTAIAATLTGGGYIQFSADGLATGSGLYRPAPDQLARLRAAIDDDATGKQLVRIVATARKAGVEITAHDTLTTAPRGYAKDHPRIELLRQKGVIAWRQFPIGAWLGTARAKDRVVAFLQAAKPLNTWLDRNVGPSELPPDDRR